MSSSIYKHVEVRGKDGKWKLLTWTNDKGEVLSETGGNLNRDYFSDGGWNDAPFTGRGFPKDMSEGFKKILEKHQEKVEESKKEFWGSDWWYSKSWVTLAELEEFAKNEIAQKKNDIKTIYHKIWFSSLDNKLNLLLKANNIEVEKKEDEDDDFLDGGYNDQDLVEYEDSLDDAILLDEELTHIMFMVEAMCGDEGEWYSNENIRIIYYFS